MIKDLFTRHPAAVGESYGEHMAQAAGFGARMLGAGLACLVHAVFPFLCERTASRAIADLHARMVTNRRLRAPVASASAYEPKASR